MSEATTTVFGIAVLAPTQKEAVEKHCFGDCGKISMGGAIADKATGGLFVCCEKVCQYTEMEFPDYGMTMSFGRPHSITVRVLKKEQP